MMQSHYPLGSVQQEPISLGCRPSVAAAGTENALRQQWFGRIVANFSGLREGMREDGLGP